MTVDDAPDSGSPSRVSAPRSWSAASTVLFVLAVAAVLGAIALRFFTTSDLWFDEALSVNIAKLPLDRIPEALRHDGHPPLYYFLLHPWLSIFGTGDFASRAFSGIFGVAALPLAWFAGKRLGGRAMGATTVLVLAASPFAIRYATEARMYSMVIVLVLAGYLALRRALERATLGRLALVALIAAALALSQYWNIFLLGVVVLGLGVKFWRERGAPEARATRRVLIATLVGCAAFAVWLPSFITQVRHTGTPWGEPQFPWVALARSFMAFAGSDQNGEAFVLLFVLVLLAFLAVFAKALDGRRLEVDLRTQPAVRWEGATALAAFLVAAGISYVGGSTFEPRYAATVLPLFLLLVAFGTMSFADQRVRIGAVIVVVALGLAGGVRAATTERTQAGQVADVIKAGAKPGDVVAYCPDQVGPAVSRLLQDTPGLVQMTFPDGARPERVNWTDYVDRINAADPSAFAARVERRAGSGTIWFVNVPLAKTARACLAVGAALDEARTRIPGVAADANFFELIGLSEYRAP
jgi:hypothetical protein